MGSSLQSVKVKSEGSGDTCSSLQSVKVKSEGSGDTWVAQSVEHRTLDFGSGHEIGRASCRERVCLYV